MKSIILFIIRPINKVLRFILPKRLYGLVNRAARIVMIEYPAKARAFLSVLPIIPNRVKFLFSRRKKKNNGLAALLSPFVECDGTFITADTELLEKIEKKSQQCELVLCCAFTGRHRIIEKIIEESLASNEAENVRWMLTGSTTADEMFIRSLARKTRKVAGFIVANKPLGRKWQTCVHFATRYFQSELYGITGSDDFVSNKLVDYIIRRHSRNVGLIKTSSFLPAMYGTMEWLIIDINEKHSLSPAIIKCSYGYESAFEPLGAGRFYTHHFMKECDGFIFDSKLERLLDDRGCSEVRDRGRLIEYYSINDGPVISVKGDWSQLNPASDFHSSKTLTLEEFSFKGHAVLRKCLAGASCRFLFKPAIISPQLNFSRINTGLD